MTSTIQRIAPEARREGVATPGMVREEAIASERMWAGLARTEGGMVSGWHHHGDYETIVFVVSGALRMESGPGGRDVVEAGANDFVHIPAGVVHRESNPGEGESQVVVIRSGTGAPVFNVDGPGTSQGAAEA